MTRSCYFLDSMSATISCNEKKTKTHKTCSVVSHFLGIKNHPDRLSIYCKDTNIGQYTHYSSNSPWRYKTCSISSLVQQAVNICDKSKLQANSQE